MKEVFSIDSNEILCLLKYSQIGLIICLQKILYLLPTGKFLIFRKNGGKVVTKNPRTLQILNDLSLMTEKHSHLYTSNSITSSMVGLKRCLSSGITGICDSGCNTSNGLLYGFLLHRLFLTPAPLTTRGVIISLFG